MATHLQELLRSLCANTEWNYAVFWKLKHRARMVLTWEDAFYNNPFKIDPSENKSFNEAFESLNEGHITQDPLGMAIAKMSYHVYSLGEGIVGQVAVTGKHRWIFANEQAMRCPSSMEICDGWEAQFAAGIKTIVVVAVVPDGVVQLGSLNKVNENVQLLTNIRYAFSSLQESTCHIQTPIHGNLSNVLQMSERHMRNVGSDNFQECLLDLDKITNKENTSTSAFDIQSCLTENSTLYDAKQISEGKTENLVVLDSMEKPRADYDVESQQESSMFLGGTELHEALGPGFIKQCYPFSWESENPEKERLDSQMPKAMENSLLTTDCGTDHLLEAIVANFCQKDGGLKNEKSFSTCESMLTTEKMQEPSINTSHTIGSSSYYSIGCSSLLEENTKNCLNSSESCSLSFSTSGYKEPMARPVEQGKPNKKRARPGESSRPRPRDRQLIQDRIKELRELVPNGAKCSIDSLLERTIKHMVFMQSVTKHADKLNNSVKSRGCSNETGVLGSGYEQGSSWAVEVGGHMKICPIVVENLNVNGQMLIEMLCEDCDHFLEITEAIRSLGLTILKGMTDNHGDKTWMRFVVESQSNRNLHRMDVLWSLVQLLQSKTMV